MQSTIHSHNFRGLNLYIVNPLPDQVYLGKFGALKKMGNNF